MEHKGPARRVSKKDVFFFARYIKDNRKLIVLLLVLFLISSGLSFLYPFISKYIVDFGISRKNVQFVVVMLIAQMLLTIGSTVNDLIKNRVSLKLENYIGISIIKDFLIKLSRLSITLFDQRNIGDIEQRLFDNERIKYLLTGQSVTLILACVNFISFSFAITVFNWRILLILISFSILELFWITAFMKKRAVIDGERFAIMSANHNNMYEFITGMQDIKLNGYEDKIISKWEKTQWQLFRMSKKNLRIEQWQSSGITLLSQLESVLISFITAYAVIHEKMTLGEMVGINFVTGQLKGSIQQFIFLNRTIQDVQLSIQRLSEINGKADEDEADAISFSSQKISSICFNNVGYRYENNNHYTLANLNFTLEAGTLNVITGNSGSGKSTFVKILSKYFKPTEGQVLINGNTDLDHIMTSSWRKRCGIAMQDGYIFSNTVKENITLGSESDVTALQTISSITNLDDFICNLPDQWETHIDKGVGLSGGQKQRILIARALYRKADVIILDEPTSSLDGENEELIIRNIKQYFSDKIIIIITHRITTAKFADQIVVLENGEVVQIGKHKDLINTKGKYYNLFKSSVAGAL